MAGLLLTAQITGGGSAWSGLYDPRRLRTVVREAPQFLKTQAEVAGHFVGDRLRPAPPVDALPPGEGAVVRAGGNGSPSTATRPGPCTRSRPAAPTWAASSPSTRPSAPGSAPATAPGSTRTAR